MSAPSPRRIDAIVGLCHEFGASRYVRGGGGNASCKDLETLWVKPSGTSLADIRADQFVAVDRRKIRALYEIEAPDDWRAREEMVKKLSAEATLPGSAGRPSVETPLHDTFPQTYVMHTHPPVVNGLACAADGEALCRKLFPEALWIPFIDPGYMLCMGVRREMTAYEKERGRAPDTVLLRNHGLFVAGARADDIRARMLEVMSRLEAEIARAGVGLTPPEGPMPDADTIGRVFDALQGIITDGEAACIVPDGPMATPRGPLTPDHIVYAKSFIYDGEPAEEGLRAFKDRRGYWPRVISTPSGTYGIGPTQKTAALALEFARDGALVEQYAKAFGGAVYLDARATDFIENWEVESYRRKVAAQ